MPPDHLLPPRGQTDGHELTEVRRTVLVDPHGPGAARVEPRRQGGERGFVLRREDHEVGVRRQVARRALAGRVADGHRAGNPRQVTPDDQVVREVRFRADGAWVARRAIFGTALGELDLRAIRVGRGRYVNRFSVGKRASCRSC